MFARLWDAATGNSLRVLLISASQDNVVVKPTDIHVVGIRDLPSSDRPLPIRVVEFGPKDPYIDPRPKGTLYLITPDWTGPVQNQIKCNTAGINGYCYVLPQTEPATEIMSYASYVELQRAELISRCGDIREKMIAEIKIEINELEGELTRREGANVSPELNANLIELIKSKEHDLTVFDALLKKQIESINDFARRSIKEKINEIEEQL